MKIYYANHPEDIKRYTTDDLRKAFLKENVFVDDKIELSYSHVDRIIFGGAKPIGKDLKLEAGDELRAEFFLQRREMGVINIGGAGKIHIDGTVYELNQYDALYVGKGAKDITFSSNNSETPSKFYIASCPAHMTYPTKTIPYDKANHHLLGTQKEVNKRQLNQYLHPDVLDTCQLSMGMTCLEEGSAWNTMPTHTHERRMEVYMYFNLNEDARVFHLMGQPKETRHIVIKNEQAVISPSWSIHSGVGTQNYSFIWLMCGENQDFDDMDSVSMNELR